ncbi:MAG: hypothetical protein QXX19_07230 [Candidatus Caldarchaeum sp.]
MVKVEGRGKFAGRTFYLHGKKSKRTGIMLYYFSGSKDGALDKIPKGRKIQYHTKGGLKGMPYLG